MKAYTSTKEALEPVRFFVQGNSRRIALGKPDLPNDTSILAKPGIRIDPILATDEERRNAAQAVTTEPIKHTRMNVLEHAIDQIWPYVTATPSYNNLPESFATIETQLLQLEARIPLFGNFIPRDKSITEFDESLLIKLWQVGVFAQGEEAWLNNLRQHPSENADTLVALKHLAQFQQFEGLAIRRTAPATPYSVILEGASANIAAVCNAKAMLPDLVAKTNAAENMTLDPEQIALEPLIVTLAMGEINRFRFLMEKLTDTTPANASLAATFNMDYFEIQIVKNGDQQANYILSIKEDYLNEWNKEYANSGKITGEIVTGCPALPIGVIKRLTEWSINGYNETTRRISAATQNT